MRWLLVLLAACGSTPAQHREPFPIRDPLVLFPTGAPLVQPSTSKRNPCFGGYMPIIATDMWKTLERHAEVQYKDVEAVPPPRRYGSCTVDRRDHQMEVRSAAGDVVAALGCGVLILAPGVRDPYGIEVGQSGGAVFSRRDLKHLECSQDGPSKVRCQFWRRNLEALEPFWYSVGGRVDELPNTTQDMQLTGDTAWSFFATHDLVEILANVRCR